MKKSLLSLWFIAFAIAATPYWAISAEPQLEKLALEAANFQNVKVFCYKRPAYAQLEPHLEGIYQDYDTRIKALDDDNYVKWVKLKKEADRFSMRKLFENPIESKSIDGKIGYKPSHEACVVLIKAVLDHRKK